MEKANNYMSGKAAVLHNTFKYFLILSLYFTLIQEKFVSAQYQQELALKQAQCGVIMTFVEQCVDAYCNMKCGGLCNIVPSTNIPVCICYPSQKHVDITHCYQPDTVGSNDNSLLAEAALCQGNCNEAVTSINPKIYFLSAVCQDLSQGEKPSRYCVCVGHHIGHFPAFLSGIIPGTAYSKSALASSQSSSSAVLLPGSKLPDKEELSARNGKILTPLTSSLTLSPTEKNITNGEGKVTPLFKSDMEKPDTRNTKARRNLNITPVASNGPANAELLSNCYFNSSILSQFIITTIIYVFI